MYVNLQAKAKSGLNRLRSIFTYDSDMLTVDLENTTEHALINLKTSTKHVYMMKVDIVLLDLHGVFRSLVATPYPFIRYQRVNAENAFRSKKHIDI